MTRLLTRAWDTVLATFGVWGALLLLSCVGGTFAIAALAGICLGGGR